MFYGGRNTNGLFHGGGPRRNEKNHRNCGNKQNTVVVSTTRGSEKGGTGGGNSKLSIQKRQGRSSKLKEKKLTLTQISTPVTTPVNNKPKGCKTTQENEALMRGKGDHLH